MGKRTGRIAIAVGLVVGASSLDLTTTTAQVGLGLGEAQATLLAIDPRSAQLSFGVRFGVLVADHRNAVARAVAHSTDYGLIGGSLTGEGCDGSPPAIPPELLPEPMRADSREPGDATEEVLVEGPITQSVLATERPFGQATSRLAELALPGLVEVAGVRGRTTSGLDDEGRPHATAMVEVARLSLAAGLVELRGLTWTASHGGGEPSGSFSIAGGSIAGVPLPVRDPIASLDALNDLLGPLGLEVAPPVAHLEGDVLFVDPLRIGIVPHGARDEAVAVLLAALQPIREPLFEALLALSCTTSGAITVVDILLGAISGGGSLAVQVGGAQASTSVPETFDGLGRGGVTPPAVAPGGAAPPPSIGPALPRGAPPLSPSTVPDDEAPVLEPVGDADPVSDGALAVGLLTVLLGVALVEADRRKMRAALAGPTVAGATVAGPTVAGPTAELP